MGFVLDDLSDMLSSGGVTTTIYKGFMPERPDDALQLVETGGFGAVHAMSTGPGNAKTERQTVQIVRRSTVYNRARAEMQVIFRLLDGEGDRTIGGTRYYWIEALQPPFALPRDESQRDLIAMNVLIHKAVTTATST